MTATLDSSLSVGKEVLEEMGGFARLHKKQVEQAAFSVLKSPDIPSILVETGFISNPKEAKSLNSAGYQEKWRRQFIVVSIAGLKPIRRREPYLPVGLKLTGRSGQ